jgi:CRP-like cAMP-binding protein
MNFSNIENYFFTVVPETQHHFSDLRECYDVKHVAKGEVLLREGEIEQYVTFVEKGLLRSYYLIDGKEFPMYFCRENCWISSYASFLMQIPGQYNVDALEDTTIIRLKYEMVMDAYRMIPAFSQFGRLLAESLYMTLEEKNSDWLLKSPQERYEKILKTEPWILMRVPQYMIAAYLGITPEALSRIRRRLTETEREHK